MAVEDTENDNKDRRSFVTSIHVQTATTNVFEGKLLPFGPEQGDSTLERNLDVISSPIHIPIRFPFFDHKYDEIRIQSNGMILFGNQSEGYLNYIPERFPLDQIACVAPYWTDVDTRRTFDISIACYRDENETTSSVTDSFGDSRNLVSDIFYRQVSDELTLNELDRIIKDAFPNHVIPRIVWAFIVTWYEVSGYQLSAKLSNTFQAIIATNGINSFSVFNYGKLEWTAGSASGSVHAQAGFNAGDLKNYFLIDKSFTPEVIELANDSNVQFSGRFIFSIGADIADVYCKASDGLQIAPHRGSSNGGYTIRLYGICFNKTNYIIKVDQTILTDCNITVMYVMCTMPMIYNGPTIQIQVFTIENVFVATTHFQIDIPEDNSELIIQDSNVQNSFIEMNQNDLITLKFKKNFITENYLFNIQLFHYEAIFTKNDELVSIVPRQDMLYSSVNLSSLETLPIGYTHIFTLATNQDMSDDVRVTLVKLTFQLLSVSTITPRSLAWFYQEIYWTATAVKQTPAFCEKWQLRLPQMPLPSTYQSQVPQCPCRVPATGLNRFPLTFNNFQSDSSCNDHKLDTCTYNNHVSHCYRRSFEPIGPGIKCCYDSNGIIITNPELGAGGLEIQANSGSSIIQHIKYAFFDQLPSWACCELPKLMRKVGTQSCKSYHQQRPLFECENVPLPVPGGGHGDPHFTTFDGVDYTFNGYGEYVLVRAYILSDFTSLEIQIRTKSIQSDSQDNQATAIVGFVIKNGNYSTVQVELFRELKLLEIRLNNQSFDTNMFFNPSTPDANNNETYQMLMALSRTVRLDNNQMSITQTNRTTYTITYSNNVQLIIKIREQYDFFNIIPILPKHYKRHCQGLLGNMDGNRNNDFTFQDGQTSLSLVEQRNGKRLFAFGESWRVTPETTLFVYTAGEHFHTQQNLHYRPIFQEELFQLYKKTPRLAIAQQSCRKISPKTRKQQCIYDILITNDQTMNELHHHFQTNINEWNKYAILVQKDHKRNVDSSRFGTNLTVTSKKHHKNETKSKKGKDRIKSRPENVSSSPSALDWTNWTVIPKIHRQNESESESDKDRIGSRPDNVSSPQFDPDWTNWTITPKIHHQNDIEIESDKDRIESRPDNVSSLRSSSDWTHLTVTPKPHHNNERENVGEKDQIGSRPENVSSPGFGPGQTYWTVTSKMHYKNESKSKNEKNRTRNKPKNVGSRRFGPDRTNRTVTSKKHHKSESESENGKDRIESRPTNVGSMMTIHDNIMFVIVIIKIFVGFMTSQE